MKKETIEAFIQYLNTMRENTLPGSPLDYDTGCLLIELEKELEIEGTPTSEAQE